MGRVHGWWYQSPYTTHNMLFIGVDWRCRRLRSLIPLALTILLQSAVCRVDYARVMISSRFLVWVLHFFQTVETDECSRAYQCIFKVVSDIRRRVYTPKQPNNIGIWYREFNETEVRISTLKPPPSTPWRVAHLSRHVTLTRLRVSRSR